MHVFVPRLPEMARPHQRLLDGIIDRIRDRCRWRPYAICSENGRLLSKPDSLVRETCLMPVIRAVISMLEGRGLIQPEQKVTKCLNQQT